MTFGTKGVVSEKRESEEERMQGSHRKPSGLPRWAVSCCWSVGRRESRGSGGSLALAWTRFERGSKPGRFPRDAFRGASRFCPVLVTRFGVDEGTKAKGRGKAEFCPDAC